MDLVLPEVLVHLDPRAPQEQMVDPVPWGRLAPKGLQVQMELRGRTALLALMVLPDLTAIRVPRDQPDLEEHQSDLRGLRVPLAQREGRGQVAVQALIDRKSVV